ncbi:MAG: topoisomerase C-terminal repeat-containing protein [Clostridia bacterium]|nr:topoisomerase C-terminal repeat-containing protein [Clostridia bacterium]
MILIIAEKPSLGRNIADAINGMGLGAMSRGSGYMEGCGYIVTWAFGHLFSLADIECYTMGESYIPGQTKVKWSMDGLPCFPQKYRYDLRSDDSGKPDEGVARQFNTVKRLCNRADVDTIVNAGDADREGEIIVRTLITKALEAPKPILRLWLPDQTAETIRGALANMKNDSEYDRLAHEGYARTFIDWLYGTNLTRYATLKSGTLLRVGRVIVPIVKAIYDRDMQIRSFTPEPYFAVISKTGDEQTGEIELQSKRRFDGTQREQAQAYADQLNSLPTVVTSVKNRKSKLSPGKLYSLTKLQNVLSKKYKMSMTDSLAIAQRLYEAGYLTYPRTNSEYLATAEKDKMKQIIGKVSAIGYPVKFKDDKSIFDDSKIEAHSALTPTMKIPGKDALGDLERKVYSTVFRRFVAVFCSEDCVVNRTEMTIETGDKVETFVLKGMTVLERGWTKYDDASQKDKILPALKKGDKIETAFAPVEKTTSPPKHYTVETLNNYLKNPFREDKAQLSPDGEDDEEEYRAIFEGLELGTEATRTGIIDNARHSRYIQLNKDVYTILPQGEYLINTLTMMGISMDKYKTSELGKALKKVYRGEMTVKQSIALAQAEIAAIFSNESTEGVTVAEDRNIGFRGDEIGICPLCGGIVIRGIYNYGCKRYKEGCKFRIPLSLCHRPIPVSAARQLLERGKSEPLSDFVSKAGKSFSASLKLVDGEVKFDFSDIPRTPHAPMIFSVSSRDRDEYAAIPEDMLPPPPLEPPADYAVEPFPANRNGES